MPASPPAASATLITLLGTGTKFPPTKMIIGNAAGSATVVDANGNSITSFPITGQEQHVSIISFSSLTTTTSLWGLY